ncbi:MAG: cytochrome c3 family protein [Acidobacteriota bacterium]|nr:cytochrome c3 family protein [Acidobacteriota bacterium]
MPWALKFLLVTGFLSGVTPTPAQISPGPLSQAHHELDTAKGCLECHGRGDETLKSRCLNCHGAIAEMVVSGEGLHGREAGAGCASCHPEHVGREFDLIAWQEGSPRLFRHERSGWALAGKHAALDCRECHKPERQNPRRLEKMKNLHPEASWLGLDSTCTSCHEDPHGGELGGDCLECHGQQAWKPASAFDHATTAFALKGRHGKLACNDCHLADKGPVKLNAAGQRVPLYKPLPHDECSDCHRDVHEGRLGADCSRCHVEEGFRRVDRRLFDHSRTRYPLEGAHLEVSCETCHDRQKAWGPRPSFASCSDCHRDPHNGLATIRGARADCSLCHSVRAFKPSIYTVREHQRSPWPLEGKHARVECSACHKHRRDAASLRRLGSAGVELRRAHDRCRDCHEDAHGGQLSPRRESLDCSACHDLQGFKPSLLKAADHGRFGLALEGRHSTAECRSCHDPRRHRFLATLVDGDLGSAGLALALGPQPCSACHADPHQRHFDGRRTCQDCHDTSSFRHSEIDPASHGKLGFELRGAHRALPCFECHRGLKEKAAEGPALLDAALDLRRLPFGERRSQCSDCHDDPHGGQFAASRGGAACDRCHSSDSFRPAGGFDHERDSDFRLGGAHRGLACEKCHRPALEREGKRIVLYRPLPSACRDCHGSKQGEGRP